MTLAYCHASIISYHSTHLQCMSRSMQNYYFSVRIWVRSFRLMESLKWPPVELLYGASKFIGYTSNSKWYKSVFWLIERGSYFQTQDERAFLHLLLIVSLHSTYSSIVFNDVLINSSAYLSLSLSLSIPSFIPPLFLLAPSLLWGKTEDFRAEAKILTFAQNVGNDEVL